MKPSNIYTTAINDSSFEELAHFKKNLLSRAISVAEPDITSQDFYSRLSEKSASWDGRGRMNPGIATMALLKHKEYISLFNERVLNDIGKDSKTRFLVSDKLDEPLTVQSAKDSLKRQSKQAQTENRKSKEKGFHLEDSVNRDEIEQKIATAMATLDKTWPEAAMLARETVSGYVLFDAEKEWSSSDPSVFGLVFLYGKNSWNDAEYFETIVHETSHYSLVVKESYGAVLLNPKEVCKSPLREDLRPLKGVLHAVFVLARMAEAFRKAISSKALNKHSQRTFEKQYLRNISRLKEGFELLKENGRFTENGSKLMNDLESEVHSHFNTSVQLPRKTG